MAQFDEWPKLLRPVAWHAAADGKNSQPGLPQQRGGKMLQVLKGIKTQLVPASRFAQTIVQRDVQAEIGIGESRHEYRHTFLVSRLQDPALVFSMLVRYCPIA